MSAAGSAAASAAAASSIMAISASVTSATVRSAAIAPVLDDCGVRPKQGYHAARWRSSDMANVTGCDDGIVLRLVSINLRHFELARRRLLNGLLLVLCLSLLLFRFLSWQENLVLRLIFAIIACAFHIYISLLQKLR